MTNKLIFACFILSAAFLASLKADDSAIDGKAFDKHIKILASDEFEGRKPFSPGETKTINYLKAEFEKLGLKPGNGKSYFQEVPMVDMMSYPAGPMVMKGKDGEFSLNYLTDFVAATRRVQDQIKVENSELVFAGYGIVAPEYGWNDYAGLDVKGKTVVVLVNDPGMVDDKLFKGNTMTYYGRWPYKYEEAARQGATGVLIIHDTGPASYGWSVVRSSWSKSRLYLQTADDNRSRAAMEGWITLESAKKLFKLAGVSPDVMHAASKKGFKPVPLGVKTSLVINSKIKKSTSHNVLALLPGTSRANEYVVYTAHWDHFGKGEAINGDSIYNGAADDASGTAALMEIATAFTKLKKKPARSILFMVVTAEEQGLLGSEYYCTHPVYPLNKTVADINMDVLQPFGRTKDVIVVGKGQSELDEYIEAEAKKQDRFIRGETDPSRGWYFRSDHFNFAKVGVPSAYIETGELSREHGDDWVKKKKEEFNLYRYHMPTDEYNEHWDLTGTVEDMKLLYNVGMRISNETTFPGWKKGSEFKAARDKSMNK